MIVAMLAHWLQRSEAVPLGTACILLIWAHHHDNCTCQWQGKCLGLRASSLRMRCEHALGQFSFASGRYQSTFQQSLLDGQTARKPTGETKRRLLAGGEKRASTLCCLFPAV